MAIVMDFNDMTIYNMSFDDGRKEVEMEKGRRKRRSREESI